MTLAYIIVISTLLIFCFLTYSHSLEIHTINNNDNYTSQQFITSCYTSVGIPPIQPINAPAVFLSKHNLSHVLHFSSETNSSTINNSIVVITELPEWYDTGTQDPGEVVAIGRLIQKHGGIGIVVQSLEKVKERYYQLFVTAFCMFLTILIVS